MVDIKRRRNEPAGRTSLVTSRHTFPSRYFLLQAGLAYWDEVSPFDPIGSTLALAFVLTVGAIKAALEVPPTAGERGCALGCRHCNRSSIAVPSPRRSPAADTDEMAAASDLQPSYPLIRPPSHYFAPCGAAHQDGRRWMEDRRQNRQSARVLRSDGVVVTRLWRDVRIGDILEARTSPTHPPLLALPPPQFSPRHCAAHKLLLRQHGQLCVLLLLLRHI